MLTEISFENYRAFEQGQLELKPITILLGANNVGKSSIIQLLLILQQTALTQQAAPSINYRSALKIHGKIVSMGEPPNLFHNKRINQPLQISTTFLAPGLLEQLSYRYFSELQWYLTQVLGVQGLGPRTDGPESSQISRAAQVLRNWYESYGNTRELLGSTDALASMGDIVELLPEKIYPPHHSSLLILPGRVNTRYSLIQRAI
jgi:hypothetical protein